ncbi:hypothetical protein ACRALDRAFT_2020656 [Sodiomyces alcalophilus JCM 7366]|uniref:uncharacterized protein n=1 Tax=Sodiomyces alcalophilus JCM 7366 TaxID=591952 RepID=UPI0039B6B741
MRPVCTHTYFVRITQNSEGRVYFVLIMVYVRCYSDSTCKLVMPHFVARISICLGSPRAH